MSILKKSAVELVADLRARHITATDLLEETIKHADKMANIINPFAVTLYDRARQAAALADQLLDQGLGGPLCGLPITVKDSQWLAGVPCANGSKTQAQFIPTETCSSIRKLEEAGAVIFAKTTCPEFSLMGVTSSELYGVTSNPWNTNRTCGGSSGGAGAAVAAGAGALSLGGDGGGSIRIPAAFCGIVGFKPTIHAVPRKPCFPSWGTLVSYGPMARSVADVRLMYSVIAQNTDEFAFKNTLIEQIQQPLPLAGKKIIVSEDLGFAPVDDDVRQTFRQTIRLLESAGAQLIYDQPNLPSSVIAWATIAHFDSWSFQGKKDNPMEGLDKYTIEMMTFGASLTEEQFNTAEAYRHNIAEAYHSMFERNGTAIFVTPTLGCEAFKNGFRHPKYIGSTKITYPWLDWASFLYDGNLTGMPACALPMGLGNEELPLSIHITAPKGADAIVLDIAEQLETLIGWNNTPKLLEDGAALA
jgi:Asp-tRNA(Asn)/Glu-tRNA(Gln) amidotransferase A subunit family amidase